MLEHIINNKEILLHVSRYVVEALILYVLFKYGYSSRQDNLELTSTLRNKLISEFKPEPLVDKQLEIKNLNMPHFNTLKYECADYDTFGLRMSNKKEIIDTIKEYGVGTCGPPGFYGTLDIHLELEKRIAKYLGVESSVLYSNSFTCINSVITCFCKQYDLVFYHKHCNEAIIRAISITKGSSICWKDLHDLENKIKKCSNTNKRNFIICEGLFRNTGELIDLPKLLNIKKNYKMRLILDDSCAMFMLHAKGTAGHFKEDIKKIDVIIGSLAHNLCGSGGFSAGTSYITDYQRLSAQSYCFSASMPGFLAKNALCNIQKALDYGKLAKLTQKFWKVYKNAQYPIVSYKFSPMIIITNAENIQKKDREIQDEMIMFRKIQHNLHLKNLRISISENPWPAVRIILKTSMHDSDILEVCKTLLSELP